MLVKISTAAIELSAIGAALSVTDEMMECHLSLPVLRMSDCPRYNITLRTKAIRCVDHPHEKPLRQERRKGKFSAQRATPSK